MYAEFFGLRELPFNNTPDPRFFYSTPDHEEALASLVYAVKERKGFVLLTGEVGAGKTLVSRLMLKHFGCTIAFANINHAIQSAGDLAESLCAEFELMYEPGSSNTQLVRILHDFLLSRFAQNLPVALVLDEAQNMPVEAFEQLRMIGNLEADDAKLLQIAIVGQPELRTLFQSPALRQLRQRVFRSFHLPALDRNSTEGYIRHRLTVAGAQNTSLFSSEAIDAIHRVSRGLPRLINTLCDNAMLSAYSANRREIDRAFIESVTSQMMLPGIEPRGSAVKPSAETVLTPAEASAESRVDPSAVRPVPAASLARPAAPFETTMPLAPPRQGLRETGGANEQAELQRRHLEVATAQAGAVAERLHSLVVSAAETIARSIESQGQLLRREEQVERLVRTVRAVALDLQPLLDDLREAAESSRREQRAAREIHERLGQKIETSREVQKELTRATQRSAWRESRAVEPTSLPKPVATGGGRRGIAAGIGDRVIRGVLDEPVREPRLRESLPRRESPNLEQMLHVTRESLAGLRELVRKAPGVASYEREEAFTDPRLEDPDETASAMRLARRMEDLAELVRGA